MKATELRIGNYVWDDYSGEMIVWAISNNINTPLSDIGLKKKAHLPSGGYKIKNIAPIPLTEQWIKDFGLTATLEYGGYGYILGNMIIFKVRSHGRSEDWFYEIEYCSGDEIEDRTNIIQRYDYVHQLQNLYFALTGKELTK